MLLTAALVCLAASEAPTSYDAFHASPRALALEDGQAPEGLAVLARSHVTSVEPRFGVPQFLWAERFPGARTPREVGLSAAEAARNHLARHAAAYRLSLAQVAALEVASTHDLGTGAVLVSFARRVHGLPVVRERLTAVMTPGYELIALSGHLAPLPDAAPTFSLTAQTALAIAAMDLTGSFPEAEELPLLRVSEAGWGWHGTAGGLFTQPPRARKAYYVTPERLVPAWQLEVSVASGAEVLAHGFVVSAVDGALLSRVSRTSSATHGYRAYAQTSAPFAPLEGPSGEVGSPHPTGLPDGYSPAFVSPPLVTLDHAGLSTGDSWLPAGATHLEGNNARAYADLFPPNGLNWPDAGLPRLADGGVPDGGFDDAGRPWREVPDVRVPLSAPGAFDYTYDLGQPLEASVTQRHASATHAFFVTNWLHDVFYDYGFDEAAGNAQQDNKGRGGVGGDPMLVEVHDYLTVDNASMTTWADGESPRLQLHPFRANRPSRVTVAAPDAGAFPADFIGAPEAVWNVTGEVAVPVTADGGFTGCADWLNRDQLAGRVLYVSVAGCGAFPTLARVMDAGAVGALLPDTATRGVEGQRWPPAHFATAALSAPLLEALDAGQSVTVTLERPPGVGRDVALDTGVVVHEWTHALAERTVGAGDGYALWNTAGSGLSEGWSDFVALWALLRASDTQVAGNSTWGGVYVMGAAFASGGVDLLGAPNQSWYFGFRRYPLSTDFLKDPLTYRHVGTNVPLPDPLTVPRASGLPLDNAEGHNAGEVWASALWEVQAALLNSGRLTFDEARSRMARYLVASLKATPPMPTFLEARDALLAVVAASSPSEDFPLVMQAFARRGFGVLAQAPDNRSTTNTPLSEDFTAAGGLYKLVSLTVDDTPGDCDDDGVLDSGETGTLTVTLMNVGTARLTNTRLSLATITNLFSLPASPLAVPASDPFTTVTVTAPVALTGVVDPLAAPVDVRLSDAALATQPLILSHTLRLHTDALPSATEGFEAGGVGWTTQREARIPWAHTFLIRATNPLSHQMRGRDGAVEGSHALVTPALQVGSGPLAFTFRHTYAFEAGGATGPFYDGGRLEVSTNGVDWAPIPGSALSPTYDGPLLAGTANPLAGEDAFRGSRAAITPVTVSLGTQYAGQTLWVRWRLGMDSSGEREGWTIDDVAFTGLTGTPFTEVVAHRGRCANKPPTLSGTRNVVTDERTQVTLLPGSAADPDGDTLTFTWLQTSGTPVPLRNGDTFTTPEVTDSEVLGFRVTVDDGNGGTDFDDVTVTVRNVNRPPTADAGSKQTVKAGARATLAGSGSDPDGDVLRYQWTQVDGVPVTLEGADTATPAFTAPPAEVVLDLTFSLTVKDATLDSAPALVGVSVEPAPKGGCGCTAVEPLSALTFLALLGWRRRR
ncbi:MAG: M36 family metallopeptidase [Myxococcales bacterium]|nr:M36 family metallopeptidase [Myxococcales bacterium]